MQEIRSSTDPVFIGFQLKPCILMVCIETKNPTALCPPAHLQAGAKGCLSYLANPRNSEIIPRGALNGAKAEISALLFHPPKFRSKSVILPSITDPKSKFFARRCAPKNAIFARRLRRLAKIAFFGACGGPFYLVQKHFRRLRRAVLSSIRNVRRLRRVVLSSIKNSAPAAGRFI